MLTLNGKSLLRFSRCFLRDVEQRQSIKVSTSICLLISDYWVAAAA